MITAQVDYTLMDTSSGLYVWVDPDDKSYLRLSAVRRIFGTQNGALKYENGTELHATVLYHPDPIPENAQAPADRQISARLLRAEAWTVKENKTLLVLILESPELVKLHQELLSYGFVHTFDPYTPHITFAKFNNDAEVDAEEIAEQLTSLLDQLNVTIDFQPCLYADTPE